MEQKFEISARQEIKGLVLDIPCRYRAECYVDNLKRVIDQLLSKKNLDCNIMNKTSVCADIARELIHLLDQRVIDSVDADLEKNSKIIKFRYKNSNPVHALIQYYEDNGGKKYAQYLFKCDPNLAGHLEELTRNFLSVNEILIARIKNDFVILANHFLTTLTIDKINLSRIHFTDSDRHHFGQQVCILEFKDLHTNAVQFVVYKPKPCIASAFLVGNMRKLAVIDHRFNDLLSLNELLNSHLILDDQLKTYLIYPCVDSKYRNSEISAVPIANHYGYVEYISHEPWQTPKIAQILNEVYKDYSKRKTYSRNDIIKEVDRRTREAFIESLRKSAQATSCDFIITQSDDWVRYSRVCGIYTMMFILAGLTDIHHGNIIISEGLPVPIDTEIYMSNMSYTIQAVGCLNSENGAMRSRTMKPSNIRVLNDITGVFSLNVKMLEANRLYKLYRRVDTYLIACNLIMPAYFEGIEKCLQCISRLEEKSQLSQWSKSPLLQDAFVRVIPFETAVFTNDLMRIRSSQFSEEDPSTHVTRQLDARLRVINLDDEEEVKNTMIYLPDNSEYLHQEYFLCSIPCYWAKINNTKLYSGDSSAVVFPENLHLFANSLMNDEVCNYRIHQQYTLISPQQSLFNRILFLSDKHNHDKLLLSLKEEEEVTTINNQSQSEHDEHLVPDYNFFTVINLEGPSPIMLRNIEEGYDAENDDSSEIGNRFA